MFQPIVRIDTLKVVGAEALSRFEGGPPSPDRWFREAAGVGLETRVGDREHPSGSSGDSAAARQRLSLDQRFPGTDQRLGLTASCHDEVPYERLLLEITEHDPIDDYDDLLGGALSRCENAACGSR